MIRRPRPIFLLLALLALAAPTARAVDDSKVIYPKSLAPSATPAAEAGNGLGATTLLGALVLAGGGAWMLWRSRGAKIAGRPVHSLAVDETRPLGNRQYLVVASYEGKKFLLGVCPGRIELLSPLSENNFPGKSS
jgi:flagellar protein FliO/FliZ